MKFLLDSANTDDVARSFKNFPLAGVTTNPSLIASVGGNPSAVLGKLRRIIGDERELHVQITEAKYEKILAEADTIIKVLGANTCIKVPVSATGLKVISDLTGKGIRVTATAVFTPMQALLAAQAGAAYVAPYVSRIDNISGDGVSVIAYIATLFADEGVGTKILAASFKTVKEVQDTALAGAHYSTVSPAILDMLISHPMTDKAISGFAADWQKVYGNQKLAEII